MIKWILCLLAITSFNLVAAPSKHEAVIFAEFNQTIYADLKQTIQSQKVPKATVNKAKLKAHRVPVKQAEKSKLVTYLHPPTQLQAD